MATMESLDGYKKDNMQIILYRAKQKGEPVPLTENIIRNIGSRGEPLSFKVLTESSGDLIEVIVRNMKNKEPIRGLPSFYGRRSDPSENLLERIERKMRPKRDSIEGFLDKSEKLIEVIERDREVLERCGISYEQISDRIVSLIAQEHLLNPRTQDPPVHNPNFKVSGGAATMRGSQDCPFTIFFGEVCGSGRTIYDIKNSKQKTSLRVSELHPHLIRDHHFFQGNTSYRVDPGKAIEVLEIEPGVDYTPQTEIVGLWLSAGSTKEEPAENHHVYDRQAYERRVMGEYAAYGDEMVGLTNGLTMYVRKINIGVSEEKQALVIAQKTITLKEPVMFEGDEVFESGTKFTKGRHLFERKEFIRVVGSNLYLF